MDGVSTDQEHMFQSTHQPSLPTKKFQSFHNLDIPPRKLLTQRLASLSSEPYMKMHHRLCNQQNPHDQYYSPRVLSEETLFHKFLPNSSVDDDSNPYVSDEFRMYEFKVRKCTRSRSHDWTDCPFAHPGEKARRRCPRRFSYSGIMCPDFRRGCCVRGDTCEYAHGVFEYWLHPSRYRTEACKDGRSCVRKVCFFAHTSSQLRSVSRSELLLSPNKHCANCQCHRGIHHTISPNSVLDGNTMSPPSSPPFSPAHCAGGYSPVSRFQLESSSGMNQPGNVSSSYKEVRTPQAMKEVIHKKTMNMTAIDEAPNLNPEWMHSFQPAQYVGGNSPISRFQVETSSSGVTQHGNASIEYKEVMTPKALNELINKMKVMNVNANDQTPNSNPEWVDFSAACNDDQRLFFTPSPSPSASRVRHEDDNYAMNDLNQGELVDDTAITRPDLEWVNDLLT